MSRWGVGSRGREEGGGCRTGGGGQETPSVSHWRSTGEVRPEEPLMCYLKKFSFENSKLLFYRTIVGCKYK